MAKRMGLNFLGGVLMIVLLILMFSPYWFIEVGKPGISIQDYVWFPGHHKDLVNYFNDELAVKKFDVTTMATMPVLNLVICALGALACFFKSRKAWASAFPTAAGLLGIVNYLSQDTLRLGSGWAIHLVVCIAMFVVGMCGLFNALIISHIDASGTWRRDVVA